MVDKPAGLVVHPGAGHQQGTLVGGLLGALSRSGRAGGGRGLPAGSAGHRAPARQGDVGAPGGGPDRAGLRRPGGPAGRPQHAASLPGPGRGIGGRRPRRDRRAHRALDPDADEDGGRGRRAGRPDRLHRAGAPRRPPPDDAGRAEPAERADPSDPRPHGGHRPPGGGRCPLRHARAGPRARPVLPARLPAGLHPPGERGARGVLRPPCRRTSSGS